MKKDKYKYKRMDMSLKKLPKCQNCEIILSNREHHNTRSKHNPKLCVECYEKLLEQQKEHAHTVLSRIDSLNYGR